MACNEKQAYELWEIRDLMGPAIEKFGHDFKYDISIDPKGMNDLTKQTREKIKKFGICTGFGHIGDDNLHLLTSCYKTTKPEMLLNLLEPYVYEYV